MISQRLKLNPPNSLKAEQLKCVSIIIPEMKVFTSHA